ncbi:MAG: OsmC domain/YcaO domain-containing protein, partial [Idiomarina sp.]|nr:OsmC domain/YcaO domain-containing protein [Idiomarina sp.]
AIEALLEITLDDELELDDYRYNLGRMYGENVIEAVIGSVQGTTRFYGLTPTNMQLEGIDRHLKLLDSYKKLHRARAKSAS